MMRRRERVLVNGVCRTRVSTIGPGDGAGQIRPGICVPNRSLVSILIAAASQLCKRCVFCSDLKIFTKDAISCGLMGLRIT